MPRKLRLEYAGAIYHVISRGNYRKDLFAGDESGAAFERALFETVERCGWELLAYVIMSNHYHLAVRTPEANLVTGMKWLQSTFATRFNRFTGARGQVFQGRYKSLVVGDDQSLMGLMDYIHLNPVRAKMKRIENLEEYQLSSYAQFWQRKTGCVGLSREATLSYFGLPKSKLGLRKYRERLKLTEEADPKKQAQLLKRYCRGWFLGSASAKRELAKRVAEVNPLVGSEGANQQSLNEERWEQIVQAGMSRSGKVDSDLADEHKGAAWKVEIAKRLRRETTAGNGWIAERLAMGHRNHVSLLVNRG